jgi:hypothetical protein
MRSEEGEGAASEVALTSTVASVAVVLPASVGFVSEDAEVYPPSVDESATPEKRTKEVAGKFTCPPPGNELALAPFTLSSPPRSTKLDAGVEELRTRSVFVVPSASVPTVSWALIVLHCSEDVDAEVVAASEVAVSVAAETVFASTFVVFSCAQRFPDAPSARDAVVVGTSDEATEAFIVAVLREVFPSTCKVAIYYMEYLF